MWDRPENAVLWRQQREEFSEEAAQKKKIDESSKLFKNFMKRQPWDDYN